MTIAEAALIIAEKLQLSRPIVFFDTETTGVNTVKDRIVEYYFFKIFPDGGTMTLESLVNPEMDIPLEASNVHNITNDDVAMLPTFTELSEQVFNFIDDCDLAGFNINKFDVPLLMEEFSRAGIDLNHTSVDFVDIAVVNNRLNPRTLSAVYKLWTGKDLNDAHMASVDVDATVEVFAEMLVREADNFPTNVSELDLYCKYDSDNYVDFKGLFIRNEGKTYFNFGKNKGLLCREHKTYLQWMYNPESGFSADVRLVAKMLLNKELQ